MKRIIDCIKYICVTLKPMYIFLIKDNHGESKVPNEIVRDLARVFLSHILEMYSTEEGRKQIESWKEEQDREKATESAKTKNGV